MQKRQIYNPYLPSYEYIPDGEPHIFDDRLYIYGSHDRFGAAAYCENDYVCWSAPVCDLSAWRFEGEIYNRTQHPHHEEQMLLFAPDVVQGADGRYYLYYSMAHSSRMSVAVCDTPAGRYTYLGDVCDRGNKVYGIYAGDYYQFDPGVFRDEDGSVYLYAGFCPAWQQDEGGRLLPGAHVCRLGSDMMTMEEKPHLVLSRTFDCPPGAEFFEAPSMRRLKDRYYLIYSARINGLHYAVSNRPDQGFVYGGRLHSASDVGLRGYTPEQPAYPNGNTHGSLIEINHQYYIFDHRFTNQSSYCRQGVAEPVIMDENGLLHQAEATSCGLNGGPLAGAGTYPAYIACCLRNLKAALFETKEQQRHMPYITQDGGDRESGPDQYIRQIQDGTLVGYKYFSFHQTRGLRLVLRGCAKLDCFITTDPDAADKKRTDYAVAAQAQLQLNTKEWTDFKLPVDLGSGVRPLYFLFEGTGWLDMQAFEILV